MAIALTDNIRVGAQKPIEDKYFNGLFPYTSVSQAENLIAIGVRFIGLTVNINTDEYWFKNAITNGSLILKGGGSGGGFVPYTGAIQNVDLGVFQLFTPLVSGSSSASGILTLESTSNLTKGFIRFGANSAYDEAQTLLGINNLFPTASLDLPVGTTQYAPLRLSPLTGTNFPTLLTTPQEGAIEYDLNKLYFTLADTALGTLPTRQTVILDKNLDGVNIEFGTTTGTQIGTNLGEKLSFWGTTPITQPINTTAVDTLLVTTGLIASGATSYSFTTDLEANALIKTGGLGTEYLMADGTVTTGVSGGLYGGSSPSTVPVQNYPIGTVLSNKTYDDLFQNIYAPYSAPSISVLFVTPTLNYNATQFTVPASTVSVSFLWTKANNFAPNLISAVIEYERPAATPPVTWTPIPTTIIPGVGLSTTISASNPILLNPTTIPDNATVNFRVTCIDSGGTNVGTAQTAFLTYQLPTANLTLATIPALQNGKYIRPVYFFAPTTNYALTINGTITQNSVNVNIATYELERAYSNNPGTIWTSLVSGGFSSPIPTWTDTTQPNGQSYVYVRARITDPPQNTSLIDINNVSSFRIYRPVFFGAVNPTFTIGSFSPANLITSVSNGDLVQIPNGIGAGLCNYSETSADRFINSLQVTILANVGKKFCLAYPSSYGPLVFPTAGTNIIKDVGSNSNIQNNFSNNSATPITVTFPDGTTEPYIVYLYNLTVSGPTTTVYIISIIQ